MLCGRSTDIPSRSVAVEGRIWPRPAADSGRRAGDHVRAPGALEEDHRLERVGVDAVALGRRLDLVAEGGSVRFGRGDRAVRAHLVDHVRGRGRRAGLELGARDRRSTRTGRPPGCAAALACAGDPRRPAARAARGRRARARARSPPAPPAAATSSSAPATARATNPLSRTVVPVAMLGSALSARREAHVSARSGLAWSPRRRWPRPPGGAAKAKGFKYGVTAGDVSSSSAILWAKAKKSGKALAQITDQGRLRRLQPRATRSPR